MRMLYFALGFNLAALISEILTSRVVWLIVLLAVTDVVLLAGIAYLEGKQRGPRNDE